MRKLAFLLGAALAWGCAGAETLETQFAQPPPSARPWVYWFPLDGNITSNGITADLEAMARVGIGGVLYMETAQGTPKGDAPFASDKWFALLRHACKEAARLGIEINMNNDAGWCGSGGPWIKPEQSMQRVVWSEQTAEGPAQFSAALPTPQKVANFYGDIAVYAFPTPESGFRIPQLRGKSCETRVEIPFRAAFPKLPAECLVPRDKIVVLTDKLGADGKLVWDVPAGNWTILRIGHTSTGKDNHPAPEAGRGLECDKLSKEALDSHFGHLMGRLIAENRELTGVGKTLVRTHIDSWEVHSQNWTPRFAEEFKRLRGYDPMPLLPAMAGYAVDSVEVSERFLCDVRQTVCDLLMENYAGHMRELARKNGIELSIEAYGDGPYNNVQYGGVLDEPMAEFWSWSRYGAASSCLEMSSSAHIYGKPILGAEAFTATDAERWQSYPGNIKDLGDWAFCSGINRFVFHRYALQPWADVKPGVSMGPWGLHYERTQTWWEQSKAWHTYLARCQTLLQQGLTVADICFLMPEVTPQEFHSPLKNGIERQGYSFDGCPAEALLSRMSVKDGRLTLPDGMSYRLLVLPKTPVMSAQLLRKVRSLVMDGATVLGNPPLCAPGLAGYPQCDEEVRGIAKEIWGGGEPPAELTERTAGKGRIIWGRALSPLPDPEYAATLSLGNARWIWYNEGEPWRDAPPATRYFRKVFTVDGADKAAPAAQLTITADNEFTCWVNGKQVGEGNHFERAYRMDVGGLLKAGQNVIAVRAVNISDKPNPAGLIAALNIKYADGRKVSLASDKTWEAAKNVPGDWQTNAANAPDWSDALALGPYGMAPWGNPQATEWTNVDTTPDYVIAARELERMGLPPDFTGGFRYIHKSLGDSEIYFIANREQEARVSLCGFRIAGAVPEFWHPDTGIIEKVMAFKADGAVTRVPLRLGPAESVFVVFRKPTAAIDPVVAFERDGQPLLPSQETNRKIVINKALYGILAEPSATRDVTDIVRSLVEVGTVEFPVAKMAENDDPAFKRVKTLTIEYTLNGVAASATGLDGQTISLGKSIPAGEEPARLRAAENGSVSFEVFQSGTYTAKTESGRTLTARVESVPAPLELTGDWGLSFPAGGGAPEHISLPKLISWSEHSDEGVKHFSGTATYRKAFDVPATMVGTGRRFCLDLGRVEIMADVTLNGKKFETLWKRPFTLDVTDAVKAGPNELEIRVVNLWINRMIGDESLPDDSPRKNGSTLEKWPDWILAGKPSPTGRFTFTSHRLWKKTDALVPSGLLGPVVLRVSQTAKIKVAEK